MTDQHDSPGCPHGELAVGWALHALEPAEEILVAAHLPDCSECTRTVAETELVGATLGMSVPEAIPSADLEQQVLAVTTTAQVSPVLPAESPAPPAPPEPPAPPAPHPVPQVTSRPTSRPAAPLGGRVPRPRNRREPLCVPDILKLILVALLVLVFATVIVFYAIP